MEWSMDLNLTTFAGLAAATMLLISMMKHVAYNLVKGYEMVLALMLPMAFAIAMKATGEGFVDVGWVHLIVASVMASMGAGLGHDKLVPVAKSLLGGKGAAKAAAGKAGKGKKKKK